VLLLFGTDMLSSFAEAGQVAEGLARSDLIVCHDLFMNDTARRSRRVPAEHVVARGAGCKSTNTHLYLMDRPPAPGETRPLPFILKGLAGAWASARVLSLESDEGPIDAILDHPSTGHAPSPRCGPRAGSPAGRLACGVPGSRLRHAVGPRSSSIPSGRRPSGFPRSRSTTGCGVTVPAGVQAGAHAHPVPRLLRPMAARCRTLPARPQPRLWISPVDAAAARPRRRRRDPPSTTSAGSSEPAPSSPMDSCRAVWMRTGEADVPETVARTMFAFGAGQASVDATSTSPATEK